jgi:hypothetical protein
MRVRPGRVVTAAFPSSENTVGRHRREEMCDARDAARPPGLMAGAETCPIVSVEVLEEEQQIPPVRIVLKHPRPETKHVGMVATAPR